MEIPELANTETDPPQNLQDNGAMPPVSTQPSLPYSPLEDTSVASAEPPPCPRVESGDAALQACAGDLPDVFLIGADYMFYGVYQYWMHKNPGEQFYGVIAEDSKCKARWEKIVCIPTQHYDAPSGKFRKRFFGILSVELNRVCDSKFNAERVIVFQSVILQRAQGVNNSAQICKRILF